MTPALASLGTFVPVPETARLRLRAPVLADFEARAAFIAIRSSRSIALGLRLGGEIDPGLPGVDPRDVVIRHDLRRAA